MRKFYLLRGIPGSGKSTWIKKNNLEDYTISTDKIRIMFNTPDKEWNFDLNSTKEDISQENNKEVFEFIDKVLEYRFMNENTTILDATNIKLKDLNKYYKMAKKFNYKVYVIDFMQNKNLNDIKNNNLKRSHYVPEAYLDKQYNLYNSIKQEAIAKGINQDLVMNNGGLPKKFNVIRPNEFNNTIHYYFNDMNEYKKIKVIGDIHSCAIPLKKILGKYNKDTLYIFLGDYFDRGTEPIETMKILNNYLDKRNVIFLKGNHEIHIQKYIAGIKNGKGYEFMSKTLPKLKSQNDIDTNKFLRKLLNRLQDVSLIFFDNKRFIFTHAGLMPEQLDFDKYGLHNSNYFIKGLGKYELDIDKEFNKIGKDKNIIQIHGHRNNFLHNENEFEYSYNLEQKVEFGNKLGALEIIKD